MHNAVKVRKTAKDTKKLFSRSVGILFVYSLIFSFLSEDIFFPVSRKLWSLSLLTVEEGYISEQNILSIFTHPLVLIAGIFAIAGFCILCLWETAGLTMILEYSYQGKAVRFSQIGIESFRQIRHCLKTANWMIFVYMVVVQPLINSDFSGQMLSSITIPEFISDFIEARLGLLFLTIAVLIVVFIFYLRYLFVPLIMILEKKSFKEAAGKSAEYLKGRSLSTYVRILAASVIGTFFFSTVPYVITYGLEFTLVKFFSSYDFAREVGQFVFQKHCASLVGDLKTIFVKIFISAMLLVVYHMFEDELGREDAIFLPETCVKKKGKIYSFRKFIYFIYCVLFLFSAVMYILLTVVSEWSPEITAEFINTTQIAAHKGYSSKAPENTLPAFELAIDCDKVDYIELDVRETKDGVPVVIHDANLASAAGEDILIYDLELAELQKIPVTYGFDSSEFASVRISPLEDILKKYAGVKDFIIEIKASDKTPQLPAKVVDLMEKYGIERSSVVHSGNYQTLKAVKEKNPDILCGFIIAVSTSGYADLPYADFFSVEHTYISDNMIDQIHARGKEVYVWTVNDISSFEQVRSMGADVLITDYPEDAYEGIHEYDLDLIEKLSKSLELPDQDDLDKDQRLKDIDYNGTGD